MYYFGIQIYGMVLLESPKDPGAPPGENFLTSD